MAHTFDTSLAAMSSLIGHVAWTCQHIHRLQIVDTMIKNTKSNILYTVLYSFKPGAQWCMVQCKYRATMAPKIT